jgi:Type IV secretion system pilin
MIDQLVVSTAAALLDVLTHVTVHAIVSRGGYAGAVLAAAKTLPEVIEGVRAWVMGILAAVATLFLVIGGLRYMAAAGDPAQIEQAKGSFKAALTGYALAVLAPVILQALQGIIGG